MTSSLAPSPEPLLTPPQERGAVDGLRLFLRNFAGCWPLVLWCAAGVIGTLIPVLISPDGIGKRVGYWFFRRWSAGLLRGFGVRVWVKGLGHVDPARQYIVASNHRSHLDVPSVGLTLPMWMVAVHKRSLEFIPIIGWAIILSRSVGIDRDDKANARRRMEVVRHRMATGRSILIFPEGTRSTGQSLRPFKKGAAVLAIEQQCPILPVTVRGSDAAYPRGAVMVRPNDLLLTIHPAIDTSGRTPEQRDEVTRQLRARIESAFVPGSPSPEELRGAVRIV